MEVSHYFDLGGRMYFLLDVNYTLVANSRSLRGKGRLHRYQNEQYRVWLLDLLRSTRPAGIFLVTICPEDELVVRRKGFAPILDRIRWLVIRRHATWKQIKASKAGFLRGKSLRRSND